MIEYGLGLSMTVWGDDLIKALEDSAKHFGYGVKVKPLRDTNPYRATRAWRIYPVPGFEKPFLYQGKPAGDHNPEVKSVQICDTKKIPRSTLGSLFLPSEEINWTMEAILDKNEQYRVLPIEVYVGDGLKYGLGWGGPDPVARASPLKHGRMLRKIMPKIDELAVKTNKLLLSQKI
ncbi:MAG: hypothetical protein JW727_03345 [Candidatus Aenigmarchaeota archaeon]|nr:hypothetical protein [Candidatus Aenigmarchaeota archaeon]